MTPFNQGVRICDRIIAPDAFSSAQLADAMYRLTADADDAALILESCTPEEADALLNPGVDLVVEAVTAVKNRLDRTMSALVRVFARHGKGVQPYEYPSIGPDRKNALFAYKTVTFTMDDGQTVSILFHSPGRDPMKLVADDLLIAYRWMLNRRDITAIVSPEGGRDINLQTMARRIMQLVEENSEKFQANNEKRQEQAEALAKLESEQAAENEAVDKLTQQNADLSGQIDDADARIARLRERLEAHGEADREGSGPEPEPVASDSDAGDGEGGSPAESESDSESTDNSGRVADYLSRIEQAETAKDVGAIGVELEGDSNLSAEEYQTVSRAIRAARVRFSQEEEAKRQELSSPEQIDTVDGWQVSHGPFVDFTLTAQAALGVDSTRVNVKARNGNTIGTIERDDVNAFAGGDTSTFTPTDNWKTTYSDELKQLMGLANTESSPAQEPDSLEALDGRLYRDISRSITVIRGIDLGTEQGYNRSLFSSSIANKLKTQARNGNEEVVDAALLLIAQQSIDHGRPVLAKRNAIWSATGNDMDYYMGIAQRQASADTATAASEDEPPAPEEQDDTPTPTEPEPESSEPTEADRISAALQGLLSGTDSTEVMDALETLMDEAEAAGIDIDNDPDMLAVSDHITGLLEKEAA
ncbi:hypothetical protein [Vreelandella alkaliphila]|uniref:Defence against restriction A N-terminal domain-containing protein n=1 Tax=Vreelandella alkaliphila TaxID=272774 RepID=A0AAJ2S4F3_9GAMM|nr:hypothetical protein [Halomonas alkaliphila]MDX5979553.1 hypothetical protein [Halomonas alkaliphila]